MRILKIFILFWVYVVLASYLYSGDYNSTELINAQWGKSDAEFGLILEAEGNCPQALAISENGELIILDNVNSRVQIFTSNGKWIRNFPVNINAFDIRL